MNSSALPSAMEQKLRQIRWRQSLLASVRGLAIAASVLIVAMVVAMALDWSLTLFSTGVRTSLTIGSVVLAVAVLVVVGAPPLLAALRVSHAASNADEEVPQLEERWTTVTSFANSEHQPTSATGRAMLQQVTSEAVAMGRLVRPAHVARPAAIRPAVVMLGACGLVLAAFLAINWAQTSVLMQRFWSPATNITATQLKSLTGDVEIPRGESIDLVTELSGLPRETATLELATGDEFVDSFELTPDETQASAFIHQLTVDEPFRYRVIAGDGQTPWHTVGVIDHPSLGEVRLTVTAPEYAARPKYEKSLIPARVRVIQGSRLELLMKPADALERLELALRLEGDAADSDAGPTETVIMLRPDPEGWYRFETQLIEDVSFQLTLVNSYGLTNEDRHRCRIQVIPDKAPFARVVSPTDEMAVAFDDVIPIKFEAHDDHGIATAELVIYDETNTEEGDEPKILEVIQIPLGDQKFDRHVLATTELDLKKLGIKEGTNISYTIRVTDTRMLEFDPDNMRARMADTKPGDSKEASQMAEGTIPKASARDEGDAKSEVKKDSDSAAEKMKNMLTSAGKLDKEQRAGRDTRNGDEDVSANKQSGEPSHNESETGRENPKKDGSDNGDTKPASKGDKTSKGSPASGSDEPKEKESSESDRQDVRTAAKDGTAAKGAPEKVASELRDNSEKDAGDDVAKDESKDASGEPNGEKRDDNKPEAGTDAAQEGNAQDGNLEAAIAARNSNQKDAPLTDRRDGEGAAKDDKDHAADSSKNPQSDLRKESSERDAENAKEMLAQATAEIRKNNEARQSSGGGGSKDSEANKDRKEDDRAPSGTPLPQKATAALTPQQSESGQNTETQKRKLKITQKLTAVAAASGRKATAIKIRDRVTQIDEMLAEVETALTAVVERNIPDADRSEQFRSLDKQLGDIETYVAELRNETKELQFAFAGLQMVHISRTHVTPARDRTYRAIREPLGTDNPTVSLHHVVRAREMLAALLKRYDRVARDEELAKGLEKSVEMYEVLVERSQQLMREARQNRNPLKRQMAVIKVDQDYLDRYAEVVTMRRELLAELGRMLGEDPRLLSRYLDNARRRRDSLRDQLSEIVIRQEEITTELSNWQLADESQQADLWAIIAEIRIHAATPLAREAAGLAERVEQAMPLILQTDQTTPALVIEHAQRIARLAREITFDRNRFLEQINQDNEPFDLLTKAEQLSYLFGEFDAALEQLNFENEDDEETGTYVASRLLESRTIADQADAWAQLAGQLEKRRYAGLAEVDQQSVALLTELLRIDMLGMEEELNNQFQQTAGSGLPGGIADMIRELHRVMEAVTFNQAAATFAATKDRLAVAEAQEIMALDGFEKAEKLFDQIRRAVVAALDSYDVDDPSIADLRDPTLDEILARLEREPGIEAQLGIPNRPRNLRVLAQTMTGQQGGGGDLLSDAREAARQRARKAMQMVDEERRRGKKDDKEEKSENEMTDEERQEQKKAKEMQETLEKSLASIREKIEDPQTTKEQRRKLEEMAEKMQRVLRQSGDDPDSNGEWQRIVESEKANEMLKALASGRKLPDSQWNKLLSTLDDGVWQVGGKTPPEDYRKAIERYQERIRKLMSTVGSGAE
tara:strand:- start:48651 stop:53486 length:4836 start_codon:yes stop_codon:yes gene_type:complete